MRHTIATVVPLPHAMHPVLLLKFSWPQFRPHLVYVWQKPMLNMKEHWSSTSERLHYEVTGTPSIFYASTAACFVTSLLSSLQSINPSKTQGEIGHDIWVIAQMMTQLMTESHKEEERSIASVWSLLDFAKKKHGMPQALLDFKFNPGYNFL